MHPSCLVDGVERFAGEDEGEGRDGHPIPGLHLRPRGQPLPIDEGAVGALQVLDIDRASLADEPRVLARDQWRIDGVVAMRVAADGDDVPGYLGLARAARGRPDRGWLCELAIR